MATKTGLQRRRQSRVALERQRQQVQPQRQVQPFKPMVARPQYCFSDISEWSLHWEFGYGKQPAQWIVENLPAYNRIWRTDSISLEEVSAECNGVTKTFFLVTGSSDLCAKRQSFRAWIAGPNGGAYFNAESRNDLDVWWSTQDDILWTQDYSVALRVFEALQIF